MWRPSTFLSVLLLLVLLRDSCQDLIAQNRLDVSSWFDFGSFCMRVGDMSKAEECFREVVSIDQQHEPSLILLGVLAYSAQRYTEVRTWLCGRMSQVMCCQANKFLEAATGLHSQSVVAWTVSYIVASKVRKDSCMPYRPSVCRAMMICALRCR